MSEKSWFLAIDGKQQGPFPESELAALIAAGRLTRESLVWTAGMENWQRAADVSGLDFTAHAPPPPPPPLSARPLPGSSPEPLPTGGSPLATGGPFSSNFGAWGLFWRGLVIVFATLLVIPTPWVFTRFYGWLVRHIQVPQWPNLEFTGRPGDIWYVFMLTALCTYAGLTHKWYMPYLLLPVQAFFSWMILRWVVANIASDGRPLSLTFTGDAGTFIGWQIFLSVSVISIIGWAWVLAAWMRWNCRHIAGTSHVISFNARGWDLLWRGFAMMLSFIFVIPIPWTVHWFARWQISQFAIDAKAT